MPPYLLYRSFVISLMLTPFAWAVDTELLKEGPTLRGTGENREMLLHGRVLGADGKPASGFSLVARVHKSQLGRDVIPTKIEAGKFEVWVPVSGSHWRFVELTATAKDGASRANKGIGNRELRQAAIEGIELRLIPATRSTEITVTHAGVPVPDAYVNAELSGNILQSGKTDAAGKVTFKMCKGEKLDQLTAWTDDFRIGGFSFSRKPRRDPLGLKFEIELDKCRDQVVRFVNVDDSFQPVPNLDFELVMGTGRPNYNFAAVPASFPHCRMTTDEKGEATNRWFLVHKVFLLANVLP